MAVNGSSAPLVALNSNQQALTVVDWPVPATFYGSSSQLQNATTPFTMTVETDQVPVGYWWLIDLVEITSGPDLTGLGLQGPGPTPVAGTRFDLYQRSVRPDRLIASTDDGASAVADFNPPLIVPANASLVGAWTAHAGATLNGAAFLMVLTITYRLAVRQ